MDFSTGGQLPTRVFSQRLGASLAYGGYRLGLAPSVLTLAGGILGVGTSLAYAILPPGPANVVALALAYQLAYGFDCADGQLARASQRTSEFGAWLDLAVDYIRYIAVGYAILAVLARGQAVAFPVALAASAIFVMGTVVSLHTSISAQQQAKTTGQPRRAPSSPLRSAVRTFFDTPVLLLMLCILRDAAPLLLGYVIAMGLGNLLVAGMLAQQRFAAR